MTVLARKEQLGIRMVCLAQLLSLILSLLFSFFFASVETATLNNYFRQRGENGFFRIVRGINNLGIESDCNWATPKKTWPSDNASSGPAMGPAREEVTIQREPEPEAEKTNRQGCSVKHSLTAEQMITEPLPHEYITAKDLPKSFDWRHVNGTNYMTWSVNQRNSAAFSLCRWAPATP